MDIDNLLTLALAKQQAQNLINQVDTNNQPIYSEFTENVINLENNTIYYNASPLAELSVLLPDTIPIGYNVIVQFISGDTATALDYPVEILFTGEDCNDEYVFTPVHNKIYEVFIYNDGIKPTGTVGVIV